MKKRQGALKSRVFHDKGKQFACYSTQYPLDGNGNFFGHFTVTTILELGMSIWPSRYLCIAHGTMWMGSEHSNFY